jgi:hypothetical protein
MAEANRTATENDEAARKAALETESAAIVRMCEALGSLGDAKARERVLSYVASLFGASTETAKPAEMTKTKTREDASAKEIPGIARATDTGELHLTVRDLKARSASDAAIRIAHLAIYANERLNGLQSLSSKNILVPILRRYRAYDGNTRGALAQHRGFIRQGDQLSMDFHCKEEAEKFIKEILDPEEPQGSWNSSARATRKRRAAAASPGTEADPTET